MKCSCPRHKFGCPNESEMPEDEYCYYCSSVWNSDGCDDETISEMELNK